MLKAHMRYGDGVHGPFTFFAVKSRIFVCFYSLFLAYIVYKTLFLKPLRWNFKSLKRKKKIYKYSFKCYLQN